MGRDIVFRIVPQLAVWICLAFAAAAMTAASVYAEDVPLQFPEPAQEARYQALIKTLRCLVCQNQSLADSEAGLAQDLRKIVHDRIIAGQSDQEIKKFLIARYGDFVLYRPPLQQNTWLLWFGPFLLLAVAVAVWVRVARRKTVPAPLNKEQERQVERLLRNETGDPKEQ